MLRKRKGPVIKPAKNWCTKIHSFPVRTCIFLKYYLTYKLHLLMLWTLLWMSEVRSCSGKNKGKGREFCLKSGKISLEGKVGLGTCESKIKAPLS